MIQILNLGAGVQSSTVLAMVINKDLPAIFADTGYEPKQVYNWVKFLFKKGRDAGINMHRAKRKGDNIKQNLINKMQGNTRFVNIPMFTRKGDKNGILKRQCTKEYKILPIDQYIRTEIMKMVPHQRFRPYPQINKWFGISYDEQSRMKAPTEKYYTYFYPLVELKFTRQDCLNYMEKCGWPPPPRSSCICCPYHTYEEWRQIKLRDEEEWKEVVELDRMIRHTKGMDSECFLHQSRKPLDIAVEEYENGTIKGYSFEDECEGMCGL